MTGPADRSPATARAWGLRVRSEIPLPFPPGAAPAEPDVTVRLGSVPGAPGVSAGAPWESAPGVFRLEVAGVARYLVQNGREITVEPAGGDEAAMGAFLLGPVMAACLQQRGVVTLHASAVESAAGAVLFAGGSGAGKSVLAAALGERGYRLLADDVAALVLGAGGHPEVLPAWPEVRLWADSVDSLGWRERAPHRVREGIEKYRAPVERFRAAPLRVHSVFALRTHNRDHFEVEAVPPAHAFGSLLEFGYGPQLAHGPRERRAHFRTLAELTRAARFARVTRPSGRFRAGDLMDRIEERLRGGSPEGRGGGRDAAGVRAATPARRPSAPADRAEPSVVWLASYPKAGNTWLRAVLTNYLGDGRRPASINALLGRPIASGRELFHRYLGMPSSDLLPEEILRLRSLFHERLAADLPRPTFVKVHEACLPTAAGPLFPPAATAGVVYLVRHPCDVAVSFAHHQQWSIDRTVDEMNRPEAALAPAGRRIAGSLPQPLATWSGHATSWLESGLPLHLVRYEDMLADPESAFAAVLRFVGFDPDPGRLAAAVERAGFERLRAQEERVGFRERQPSAPSFFRSGAAGGWRDALTPEQVRALVEAHGPVMARFGYLREAEAFLAGAATGRVPRGGRDGAAHGVGEHGPAVRARPVEWRLEAELPEPSQGAPR